MRRQRLVRPDCLEPLHEIPGRHDVDAELPHRLDGPGIHPGHIRNGVARRILHRHPLHPAEQLFQPDGELFAPGVRSLFARQVVEIVTLDRVHKPPRRALGWDQVIPAPRRHLVDEAARPVSRRAIGLEPWKSYSSQPSRPSFFNARWTAGIGNAIN